MAEQQCFISLGLNKINNLVANSETVPLFLVLSITASRTFFAKGSSAAEDVAPLSVHKMVEGVKRKGRSVSKLVLTPSNMRDKAFTRIHAASGSSSSHANSDIQ